MVAYRHLHREGQLGQRRDRPPAPLGHLRAADPSRHHRGGLRVVHLRPGLPRGVPRPAAGGPAGRDPRPGSILRRLVDMQYERNDLNLVRGKFRVRGDTIEVHPAYDETAVRIELFGDDVEPITVVDPLTGEKVACLDELWCSRHPLRGRRRAMRVAMGRIEAELAGAAGHLRARGQAARGPAPAQRTQYDLEMMQEIGFCNGIENYSRHLDGRAPGEPPYTLLDFFPDDFLVVLDESHSVAAPAHGHVRGRPLPQGDADRLRLPPAVGRRQPAAAASRSSWSRVGQIDLPVGHARALRAGTVSSQIVEQVIRPTGLVDPEVVVKPTKGQIDDLIERDHGGRRARRAGPGDHADQEDGRGPERLPAGAGDEGALPALRGRHHGAHRDPARPAPRRVRRARRASTCCARASTCPRCRSWRSSTPTRRASCAARPR